ncbi:MAG: hypothetical protein IJK84_10465 [Bacteroidales bacterium]|nr:hypothetical protein [Bacteroidales bacterium]
MSFSPGNLQYNIATQTWRFAEHQWDFVGDETAGNVYFGSDKCHNIVNTTSGYTGWIDLFGWGTGQYPLSMRFNDTYGTSADWGINAIVNGCEEDGIGLWSVLSVHEYQYLITGRDNASSLYDKGVVHSVNGLILLPDNWSMPEGVSISTFTTGQSVAGFPNTITDDDWELMESAGAVFFPMCGMRNLNSNLYGAGSRGYYWSSTSESWGASRFFISGDAATASQASIYANVNGSSNKAMGCGVRMVHVVDVAK